MLNGRQAPHLFFRERIRHYRKAEAAGAVIFSIERARRLSLGRLEYDMVATVAAAENCSLRVALGALIDFLRVYRGDDRQLEEEE